MARSRALDLAHKPAFHGARREHGKRTTKRNGFHHEVHMVAKHLNGLIWIALLAAGAASACYDSLSLAEADAWVEQKKALGCGPDAGDGSGGQGGSGVIASPECTPKTAALDCPGPPDPVCGSAICVDGQCALEIKPGPIASQKYGDCKQVICLDSGELMEVGDDTDFFNDANQCTIDFCLDGAAHYQLPDGSQCPESGDGYCYKGKCEECVEILSQATCKVPGEVCDQTICEPFTPQCMGGCGGICAPCAAGFPCGSSADCLSGVCKNNECQAPTCFDGVKNDGETGIDCGASSCPLCPANQGCSAHEQCESQVCMFGLCQAPTCIDGTLNGDEAGVDCGGAKCAPCLESP